MAYQADPVTWRRWASKVMAMRIIWEDLKEGERRGSMVQPERQILQRSGNVYWAGVGLYSHGPAHNQRKQLMLGAIGSAPPLRFDEP